MFLAVLLFSSALVVANGQKGGETIGTVDADSITAALDVILSDSGILEFTRIGLGIANLGDKVLQNPQYYLRNGADNAMPPVVPAEQTGLNLFTKRSVSLSGTEGVVTYDIEDTPLCVAVMWNVPNIGSNTMNVKIYPRMAPSRAMYDQMRDVSGEWGTGRVVNRREYGIEVAGSISTGWAAKQIVNINTAQYDFLLGPSLNAWCDSKLIGRDTCIRECSPFGKCDTDVRCDSDQDCIADNLVCTGSC